MELKDFLGIWRFDRRIFDAAGHQTGTVNGQAEISGDPQSAIYRETGTMALTGQMPMVATRKYLWQAAPAAISVRFEDGRDFHTIALQGAASTASHWCDPDDYQVAYDFSGWPDWQSDWRVRGPRKDYRLLTHYSGLETVVPSGQKRG